MLPSELIKNIRRIHITSSRVVDAMMAGQYRSVFRGTGMEFEEVREYSPGDEVKSIDWKVTARMRRPYVKLFREERELTIMLLVDMSASGMFGAKHGLKRDKAAELASVLAFNAIKNNDRVGAVLFTDRVERYLPPKKGSGHVWRLIKEILSFEPEHTGTSIAGAADFLAKVQRKKSVAFLISDFLDTGYLDSLKRAARRHDLITAMITDPADRELPGAGLLLARDLETGTEALVDCSDTRFRREYAQRKEQSRARTLEGLRAAGIDCIRVDGAEPVAEPVIRFFRYREKRMR